jgi:hypothetical protein
MGDRLETSPFAARPPSTREFTVVGADRPSVRFSTNVISVSTAAPSSPITRIVSEIVHVNLSPEELSALNEAEELSAEPMPIERHRANGSGRSDVDTGGN